MIISISIDETTREEVVIEAKNLGLSISSYVRMALKKQLGNAAIKEVDNK